MQRNTARAASLTRSMTHRIEHDRPSSEAKPGGDGLRGQDKQQSALRDPKDKAWHQGQDGPGAPDPDETPEGLHRPRKGPVDRNIGRNEAADQVPDWEP